MSAAVTTILSIIQNPSQRCAGIKPPADHVVVVFMPTLDVGLSAGHGPQNQRMPSNLHHIFSGWDERRHPRLHRTGPRRQPSMQQMAVTGSTFMVNMESCS